MQKALSSFLPKHSTTNKLPQQVTKDPTLTLIRQSEVRLAVYLLLVIVKGDSKILPSTSIVPQKYSYIPKVLSIYPKVQ